MTEDFAELERVASAIVARLSSAERRTLLRSIARDLRGSQSKRIGAQRNPDGSAYAPRKAKREEKPGAYALKFLYPKGAAKPRLVLMKAWVHEGEHLRGFDIEAGGERSYRWDQIAEYLPLDDADRARGGGTLRRRGHIRRAAMFRKLRAARNLKSGASDDELWVGFSGRAARIARVHQEGLEDRPAPGAKAVQYPRRELLGVTEAERGRIVELLLAHVAR